MKQFVYRIQPTRPEMLTKGPTATEALAVGDHFSYLKELTARGVVLLAGRTLTTDDRTFGIVVFAAESEEEAAKIMRADPAVERGVMKAELFPFGVALLSQNWTGIRENQPKKISQSTAPSVPLPAGQEARQP
jgi:uncharacterized protein YciI